MLTMYAWSITQLNVMNYFFKKMFFNRFVCVCVCVLVAQTCLTLCNPLDCSPPGSSVHGILQARILEWVAIPFFRGSSQPRDRTYVSCISRQILFYLRHQANF